MTIFSKLNLTTFFLTKETSLTPSRADSCCISSLISILASQKHAWFFFSNFLLQSQKSVHECFRSNWTTRNVNINRHESICTCYYRIGVPIRTPRYRTLRVFNFGLNFSQTGPFTIKTSHCLGDER